MKRSKIFTVILSLALMFSLAVPASACSLFRFQLPGVSVTANAEENSGYQDVTNAYTELNNFRTSNEAWYYNPNGSVNNKVGTLKPLARNEQLEQTAKIRAKEIAQNFSHTRPNGQSCFTAYPSGLSARGENIAAGQTTAAEVTNDWKETNNPYSGQGHRRNMLDSKFNAVGIACYVQNGTYYWVQAFGRV